MSTLQLAGSVTFLSEAECSSTDGRSARLQLTRRGWLVLVAIPLALLAAAALVLTASITSQAQAAGSAGGVTDTVRVNVASGETLWALAAEYVPEQDPRVVVAHIVELNALSTSTVHAGQSLDIPVTLP